MGEKIRVADYVMKFVEKELGVKHVFLVTGGGAMHLDDALGKNKNIEYVCTHHEQAAAMATEAYARAKKSLGVGLVTTGPGGTNAITGVAGAWIDSTPCLFISGQVAIQDTILGTKLRQKGVQEIDILGIVKTITKYAEMVTDPNTIKYHLQKAVYIAKTGRPGPVWVDIPQNVQGAFVDENNLKEFSPTEEDRPKTDSHDALKKKVAQTIEFLKKSERPIMWIGNGVRLAGAEKELEQLMEKLQIPVCTTWNSADLLDDNNPFYIGRPGLFGQRPANFAVQNSDFLLAIGNRLSIPQTGYNFKAFARGAKKVFVDIDKSELEDKAIKPDLGINADAKEFLREMLIQLNDYKPRDIGKWAMKCKEWKQNYPIVLPEFRERKDFVNSYVFVDALSDALNEKDVIVTDMGTSFTTTFQAFKVKKGQKFFTSSGLASMGFGLPGAIGACFGNSKKRTICLAGEGSFMFNLQELQTVMHHKLPMKIFLMNNNTYLSIQSMQDSNFQGFYVGAGPHSGVSFPDLLKVASAFGYKTEKIRNHSELGKIKQVIESDGPVFCEVLLDPKEVLQPRLKSKKHADGTMSQGPMEDMWPFLDREEFKKNMIIEPLRE